MIFKIGNILGLACGTLVRGWTGNNSVGMVRAAQSLPYLIPPPQDPAAQREVSEEHPEGAWAAGGLPEDTPV